MLVQDTLYLACTRPAMRWGVPIEGFIFNFGGVWILGMYAGSPLYWGFAAVVHFFMRPMANKNPNFFREWRMWFNTKAANAGGSLWALPAESSRKPSDLPTSI